MGMPHPSQPTMHIHACMCLYNSEKRDYYASPDSPPQVEGALMAWTYSAKSPSTYASRSSFLLSSSSQISPRSASASLAQRASLAFNASRLPDRRGGGRGPCSFHAPLLRHLQSPCSSSSARQHTHLLTCLCPVPSQGERPEQAATVARHPHQLHGPLVRRSFLTDRRRVPHSKRFKQRDRRSGNRLRRPLQPYRADAGTGKRIAQEGRSRQVRGHTPKSPFEARSSRAPDSLCTQR